MIAIRHIQKRQEWHRVSPIFFCRHGICKGFTAMTTAENPGIFLKFLLRRLPACVKSEIRVYLYDNECNLHKIALNRDAYEISKFRIFTDRHHWKNHTGCSNSYNCDKYDYMKEVNSQICEQKNRSLRKLASTLAYCGFNHYMVKVKLFFIINNFEEKICSRLLIHISYLTHFIS